MSKKQFKSSASSARVGSGAFNALSGGFTGLNFGSTPSSQLSYIFEPPDYASLEDPQLVVAVKGLLKRESVTRAKALEEISTIFSSQSEEAQLQESFLSIWTVLYPRIAIDNDRRVRQLSHTLQGSLSLALRKRIVKQLPSLISTWLGGTFDPDRVVARAAKQALEQTFSSSEKQQGVWKTYKTSIIQFCVEALTNETAATLSDERITVKDEAEAKYHRLLSTSLFTLSEGFGIAGEEFVSDDLDTIQSLFSSSKTVALAHHEDSNVRKGVYAVVRALLQSFPETLDVKQLAKHLIRSGLTADQTNSMDAYLQTLAATCSRRPEAWQQFYEDPGKKSAFSQISKFLQSFSSPSPVLWQSLDQLVTVLPKFCLSSNEPTGNDPAPSFQPTLLHSLRHAISGTPEDPRPAQLPQWQVYVHLAHRLLSTESEKLSYKPDLLLQSEVWPLIEAIISATKTGIWQSPETVVPLLTQLLVNASDSQTPLIQSLLSDSSNALIQTMQLSLPQQAKSYEDSQTAVQSRAVRWHHFEALLDSSGKSHIHETILANTKNELTAAFDLLKSRQGKPWGCAAVLLSASTALKDAIHPALDEFVVSRLTHDSKILIQSRSAGLIAACMSNLENDIPALKPLAKEALINLAQSEPSENVDYALVEVLPALDKQDEQLAKTFQESVIKRLDLLSSGTQDFDDFALRIAASPSTPHGILDLLLERLASAVETQPRPKIIATTEALAQHHLLWLHDNITGTIFRTLYESVKSLSKTAHDPILPEHAARCSALLDSIVYQDVNKTTSTGTTLQFLAESVATVRAEGVSIDELLQQYHLLWPKLLGQEKQECVDSLTSDIPTMMTELSSQLRGTIQSELGVSNILGDAISIVKEDSADVPMPSISYDGDGLSITIRRLLVVMDLLSSNETGTTKLTLRPEFLAYCAVLTQIATDQISVPSRLQLYDKSRPVSEVAKFLSQIQSMMNEQLVSTIETSSPLENTVQILQTQCKSSEVVSYYYVRALTAVVELWKESAGILTKQSKFADIKPDFKPNADTLFGSILPLALLSGQPEVERALNTLLSDLAAPTRTDQLYQLIQLNYVLRTSDCNLSKLPPQRLLFFIRRMAEILTDSTLNTEVLRAFELIAPSVATIYDDFWEKFVTFTSGSLNRPSTHLPRDVASLKVLKVLGRLADEDSNDDLKEAWQSQQATIQEGLMAKLVEFGDRESPLTQPQEIANDVLARSITKMQISATAKATQLYPVLAGESLTLQNAAYELLHRLIPSQQEEVSMESALNANFVAKLPDELLSLVISRPDEATLEADDEVMISPKLSAYFLGWALVFDHWTNASLKVQSELTDHVRSDAQPEMLFNVLVAALTHPRLNNALINPSKYDLTQPMSLEEQGSRTAAQSWACYLFYLSLLRIPNVGRTWWRDSCPRGLNRVVEEWIEKHISPVISQAELDNVSAWLSSQPDPTDGPPLDVKVNHKAHEITVSYPVDESFMIMRIRIPPIYPLSSINVESVQRLAVSEKQWQSWLITTSGIINFQSGGSGTGSIIDGLIAWRKNIVGALKGQSECAICYSIVGVSKDLPTKRCATCKNTFHGSCLLKWFKSSSSSSCPLCRNQFKF